MEISAAVATDLALLEDTEYDLGTDPEPGVVDTVLGLAADARAAVPSFLGLTVTLTGYGGKPVDRVMLRFTLLEDHADPRHIGTSLRLPPPADDPGHPRPGVAVVLYAGTPGAFVDMAADHSYATGRGSAAADLDQHRGLALQADITSALGAETRTHEAIGVLIDRGRTYEEADAEIDTLADTAHTGRTIAAATILATLTRDGPDHPPRAVPGTAHR